MNCNIIKDLLPSYVDGICSGETREAVEDHMRHCPDCARYLQMMEKPAEPVTVPEAEEAKEPFKRINKYRRLQVLASVLFTLLLTIAGSLVVQEVGVVNQFFFPKTFAIVDIKDGDPEWQGMSFVKPYSGEQEKDYIYYNSLFWKKELINDANNENAVLIRVKDAKGNIIVNDIRISPGKGVKLKSLKRNHKYFIEIKAPSGRYSINAV